MLVLDQAQLSQVKQSLTSAKKAIVIDTETNKDWILPEDRYCMGISLCIDGECHYIVVRHHEWASLEATTVGDLTGLFDNLPDVPIVMHNCKFDITVLEKLKLIIPTDNLYDTMLMAHLLDENEYSYELDSLVSVKLGIHKDVKLAKAMDQYKWEHVPAYVMGKYAMQDAQVTYNLFFYLKNQFEEFEDVWKLDRQFMLLLRDMENEGVRLDRDRVKISLAATEKECAGYIKNLGFDPGKRKLLQEYVFGTLGLKPLTYTKVTNEPQINTNFLEKTDHPFCKEFRRYKQQTKRLTSYYRPYLRLAPDGRFHPNFRQHGTVTGRLSCFDPNMQQIPRDSDIKGFFLPEDGCELWEIDYRTIEFRLAAVYAQQQNALEMFSNDGDIHQLTADLLGINRQFGKLINFALGYGAGVEQAAFLLNIPLEQAKPIVYDFRKGYSDIFKKSKEAALICEANGGKIKMWSGRYRHFRFSSEYHNAFNAAVQGGSFQIVKVGMLKLKEHNFDIRNQVHDSVWLNIDPSKRTVENQINEAQSLMSDWTTDMFGLRFSTEAHRLS